MSNADADRARDEAERVVRESYGKLVAWLTARCGDIAAAQDALSDAFAAALADWPARGCPANPEAWLLTAARRRLIDAARRRQSGVAVTPHLLLLAEELEDDAAVPDIPDKCLALMFACAHPQIEEQIRAPLMLQVVLGADAATIASVFLMSPVAMGKRLVRAKAAIREAGIGFSIPERPELPGRLEAVLDAVYAAFAGGWTRQATGLETARGGLADEAIFLASVVTALLPDEPEAFGLLALMLHVHARRAARRDGSGDYVPLDQQDTALWDSDMIDKAEAALRHASTCGMIGRFQIEAALQSAHAERRNTGQDNWEDVTRLYDALLALTGSPVVSVNRALALAETSGADAALAQMPDIASEPRLVEYQPYWAARAELLARRGSYAEARRAYDIAAGLTSDPAIRRFLLRRREALAG